MAVGLLRAFKHQYFVDKADNIFHGCVHARDRLPSLASYVGKATAFDEDSFVQFSGYKFLNCDRLDHRLLGIRTRCESYGILWSLISE